MGTRGAKGRQKSRRGSHKPAEFDKSNYYISTLILGGQKND